MWEEGINAWQKQILTWRRSEQHCGRQPECVKKLADGSIEGRYFLSKGVVSRIFEHEGRGEDVLWRLPCSLGGGVSVVGLHHAIDTVDAFRKREERGVYFLRAA